MRGLTEFLVANTTLEVRFEFGKHNRLLTSSDFQRVFDKPPIRAPHPSILILAKPNRRNAQRLGLVIAKKHVKKAVQRNRLKRLIRESFRTQHLGGIDVIVLARKGACELENDEILSILNSLWKRVIKKHSKMRCGSPP